MELINSSQVILAVKDYLNTKEVDKKKLSNFVFLLNRRLSKAVKYIKRKNITNKVSLQFNIPIHLTVTEAEIIDNLLKKHDYRHAIVSSNCISPNWFPQDRDVIPRTWYPIVFCTNIELVLFYQ